MAQYYSASWFTFKQPDPEVNSYSMTDVWPETYAVIETVDDGVFKVGEEVAIRYAGDDGPPGSDRIREIVGFYGDGVVVKNPTGDYTLYSRTLDYPPQTISLDTNDAGIPVKPPVCFTKGTLIETPDDQTPIENLKAGDMVVCSKGLGRVKWIGWRNYPLSSLRMPEEQRKQSAPIRIIRGAIGANAPSTDLLVSPWHHLFLEGVLVRANDLVNGKSIVQELDAAQVSYFHLELEQFDVVLAHGVYSESWADGGNRDFFANADVTLLRSVDMKRRLADRPGFKVLRDRSRINSIRDKLVQRASQLEVQEKAAR
ncbi:Hint domain-containing protein [Advenella kashmirensis]